LHRLHFVSLNDSKIVVACIVVILSGLPYKTVQESISILYEI
jgi:hypothetical protein